ncbi:hypothetical protein WA026_013927 [Henosepilachna vigintioctopunctata]|uniref:Serine/threonine-protein phosphatase 4 regulatory subunit 2 n=1 Tax=Henosepilachna vigintioctopunctata TaxID=420089 RepID=A0AAW1TY78_9CUCU
MENPEEILHSLEEFSKFRPKDIPRELEEYLCFVAKTGDPVYQWSSIKHLFKEKLVNVVNEFYESCPLVDVPPCPNVELFNYDSMKSFILEKLETFAAAPFTVQRICELLTTPRKEYNRIDKFMRALEKNILVVSTVEPGCKTSENGESIVNEMEESPVWHKNEQTEMQFQSVEETTSTPEIHSALISEEKDMEKDSACSSSQDNILVVEETQKDYVTAEDIPLNSSIEENSDNVISVEVNIDPLPAQVDDEDNLEPVVSSDIQEEVTVAEVVSSVDEKDLVMEVKHKSDDTVVEENVKQADSTTSLKSPQNEILPTLCPTDSKQVQSVKDIVCAIASSENEQVDTDSNESSVSTEADTVNEIPNNDTETDSNEAKEILNESEESGSYDEDSNSSHADTTKGYDGQNMNKFENKDEEITSSDKVLVSVPHTSIDDISDDESEAEAEIQKDILGDAGLEQQGDASVVHNSIEDDSLVTASSDNLKKDCEVTPMDVDLKEKGDFNEAEATCESL